MATEDKSKLLGSLAISDSQRELSAGAGRWVVTGVGALVLVVLAWLFLLPDEPVFTVKTALAVDVESLAIDGQASLVNEPVAVLDATGYVVARRQATVSSKITGKVLEVLIEEGMQVEEGQLLATLDDSTQRRAYDLAKAQLAVAKASYDEVAVQVQEAELEHTRLVGLEKKNLASTAALDRARLAEAAAKARLAGIEKQIAVSEQSLKVQQQLLDDMKIRAPFAGVVIAKAAQPGEMISPVSAGGGFTRTGICTLVDMASLEVEVDVNESYINRVKSGQPARVMLNSYPDWRIPAEVIAIIPTADRSKATVRVRIGFLTRDERILPNMGVRVAFLESKGSGGNETQASELTLQGVLVPSAAVVYRDGRNLVFVVDGDRVHEREVRLGQVLGSRRNVTVGLAAGEEVVVAVLGSTSDASGSDISMVDLTNDTLVTMVDG